MQIFYIPNLIQSYILYFVHLLKNNMVTTTKFTLK